MAAAAYGEGARADGLAIDEVHSVSTPDEAEARRHAWCIAWRDRSPPTNSRRVLYTSERRGD